MSRRRNPALTSWSNGGEQPHTADEIQESGHIMRPSGEQYTLAGRIGNQPAEVTIAQVAAALLEFTVGAVDVVQRYPKDAAPSLGAGIVMMPWPNRVSHGRWTNGEVTEQLDITEVKYDNALHGLLRNTAYPIVSRAENSITLTATIYAPNGYPFVLETFVTYTITGEGLEVRHTARNHSAAIAPVAIGTHGYFKIGGVPTEDLILTSTARSVYIDNERQLPIDRAEVTGEFDLRNGRRVGDLALDHCFTDLEGRDGRSSTSLTAPDGRAVEVWTDANFAYQVLLTTHEFIDEGGRATLAVAIEPQTAAVDALNNKQGLRELQPGEEWTARWGVTPRLVPSGQFVGSSRT